MRIVLLGCMMLSMVMVGQSQEAPGPIKRGTLAVQIGAFDFQTAQKIRTTSLSTVLGNKEWSKLQETDLAFGLSYIKGISKYFDYSVNGFFGSVKYPVRNSNGTSSSTSNTASKLLFEGDASIHMKLMPDNFIVVPYLSAGLGGSVWDGRFESFAPLGAGLQFGVGQEHFAFTNFQYRVPITQGANYHFLYSIGFGGPVGKPRVQEVKAVPVAPVVLPPADTDKDGIVDSLDKCPTVPGVAQYQGCPIPDTDGDGIKDDTDKCPTVAGVAQYQGCPVPDTDGDGIKDDTDKCPTVAGLAKYQGCPIPDTDGDGFNDEEDKCPTTAGIKELLGCPRPPFEAENVLFATGSATLLSAGKKELDVLVPYFTEFKDLNIIIEGHTDNTGDAKFNQKLSEKRANAAKTYLVSKGIEEGRIKAVGFGEDQPVADNKTVAGRKKNRRVHFRIEE